MTGALTLLLLVVMLVPGVLAWNAVGDFFGGVRDFVESVVNAVRKAFRPEMRASMETRTLLANPVNLHGTHVTASHQGATNVKTGIRSGLIHLCGASVEHYAEGTVEAGVDLSQVQASDFLYDPVANSWVLQVGAAELHCCRIDYIRQQGHSLTVCQQDRDEYRLLAESVALA